MTDPTPEWLTIKEFVARHQGRVSAWNVGESVRQKRIPHVRVGRRVLIPANALDLMAQEQGTAHPMGHATNDATNAPHATMRRPTTPRR